MKEEEEVETELVLTAKADERISLIFFSPCLFLIHKAGPQSRPVVITIFARGVCPSVRPHFSKSHKKTHRQVRIVIATGRTVGLAEWIIDGTYVCFLHCILISQAYLKREAPTTAVKKGL